MSSEPRSESVSDEEETLEVDSDESKEGSDKPSDGALKPAKVKKIKKKLEKCFSCPAREEDIEYDPCCDEFSPKTITPECVTTAAFMIQKAIPKTPLMKCRTSRKMGMELYFKTEIFHKTGSFFERAAVNALTLLHIDDKLAGVITASLGNWAMALAFYGRRLQISVTVVMPTTTLMTTLEKCREYKAKIILHGKNLSEAKHHAFELIQGIEHRRPKYLNGFDHPHVIAAAGTIGKEIMEELPETDVILVPVGGGGLIAGVAVAAKALKPTVEIYGVEVECCCSFYKALTHLGPHKTKMAPCLAPTLAAPMTGFNAYQTARSLVNKMVLITDEWIARAMLYLAEGENIIVEGAGAASLAPLFAVPDILPELQGKTVVCILSGGNVDSVIIPRCVERAKASAGRLLKLIVTVPSMYQSNQTPVLSRIGELGGNMIQYHADHIWTDQHDTANINLHLVIETSNIEHSISLRNTMEEEFPGQCAFEDDPLNPLPVCICFPKKRAYDVEAS